ncbi:rRNA pseudouridine synthase [Acidovorax sp. GBBC 3334]|uniref:pseudouridine synthase n=1 Tax=Acidovorax sp. GBBC 3334 TaxID=2940496 RepID=UPI0023030BF4|nr:pseudouridine synthase [Acidovorax sp. GBBC 3334]MDA8457381.1 rRNA pseudouridine synthase [Acidovorax sp. GBBC 3334]
MNASSPDNANIPPDSAGEAGASLPERKSARRPARKGAAGGGAPVTSPACLSDSDSLLQGQGVSSAREEGAGEGDPVAMDAPAAPQNPASNKSRKPKGQQSQGGGGGYRFDDVISGQLDADEERADVAPAKRVLPPQVEMPKLHKVLAQAGLGSRLEMEQLILEGRISVNNEPAHIGQRVQFGDQVKVNGRPIRYRIDPPPARVIAYHKPVGEVVTHDDPQNRPTVFRKLPRLMHGKWQSVGRLDLNTEGLLLFTSAGELANNLMHPRFGLEREYAVRVLGALNKEEKQRLLDGVQLDDGMAAFGSIEDGGGEGSNCWYRVTISEGRNREVRRMFEAVGHAVSRLIRIRYGSMMLPRGLKRGAWLELDERDIRALVQAAGADMPRPAAAPATDRRGGSTRGNQSPSAGRRGPGNTTQRGGKEFGDSASVGRGQRPAPSAQPDPMKTSVGYIGGDSLSRHRQEQKQKQKRNGINRRGSR